MKKKRRMPSQAVISRMNRAHAKRSIPESVDRIEKLQMKLARARLQLDQEIRFLVEFAKTLEAR